MHFQAFLVSGASDGLLILWSADHIHDSRELVPKLSLKVFFCYFFSCLFMSCSICYLCLVEIPQVILCSVFFLLKGISLLCFSNTLG